MLVGAVPAAPWLANGKLWAAHAGGAGGGVTDTRRLNGSGEWDPLYPLTTMVTPPAAVPAGTSVETDSLASPRLSEMPHTVSPDPGSMGTSVSGSGGADVPSDVGSSVVSSTPEPRNGDPRSGEPRNGAARSGGTPGPKTDRSKSCPAGTWLRVTVKEVPGARLGRV